SSDSSLFTNSNFTYTCDADSYILYFTPTADLYGSCTITVIATDAGGLTASDAFALTVLSVEDSPVIVSDSTWTMNEDATASFTLTATDAESADCSIDFTYTSSDTTMLPIENISYTCTSGIYYLTLTPTTDQSGNATLTITVTDGGGLTAIKAISLTVTDINDSPLIGSIADQTTLEDIATSIISFTATDLETAICDMSITLVSSDQSLVPDEYLLSLCSGNQYSIVATPALNQYGTATISITITDGGGLSTSTSFNLTVTDVDDNQYMWTNFQAADVVLGQSNFTTNTSGTTGSSLNHPTGVAVDPITGKVFISERDNNRILRFSSSDAAINGSSAEAVFGQADFTSGDINRGGTTAANTLNSPESIYVDSFGRLWVADRTNHRILRFDNASSKASGADADAVFGQTDFTSNAENNTQNTLRRPTSVWIDPAGRMWVADMFNHRVLRFDDIDSKSNGANADGVLGQANFTNMSSGVSQNTMTEPHDIFGDNAGNLFVTNYSISRALRFNNAALKSNGANADNVLGQSDFTSSTGATSANNFNYFLGITMDHSGRLYGSDLLNNRIVIFNDVINKSDGASIDNVLGQPNFTSNTVNNGGIGATTLYNPQWLYFDRINNHLWVTDYENHRVLRYTMMLKTPPTIGLINDSTMDEDTVS
ncbi:NHL repeat protein, partial [Candidatus Magnetomorum sp. HK-1]